MSAIKVSVIWGLFYESLIVIPPGPSRKVCYFPKRTGDSLGVRNITCPLYTDLTVTAGKSLKMAVTESERTLAFIYLFKVNNRNTRTKLTMNIFHTFF